MRKILLLGLHDLRLTARDRASFFWMLVFPIVLMWFFGQMGGGGGGTPKVRLTVVDGDGGWLARAFVAELASPNVEVVPMTAREAEQAESKVRTLVIPEGFTENVLAGEAQELRIERDEGANVEFSRAAEVNVARAIARTLARLAEMKGEGTLGTEAAPGRFAEMAGRERLVRLEVSQAGAGRPVPTGTAQSVPGIMTMTVLMMTVIYGGVFLTLEKRDGTLRRQAAGPVGRGGIVAGKILGRLLIALLQAAILVGVGAFAFGVDFGRSRPALVVLLVAYAISSAGLATLCGAVFRTPEQVSAIGWLVTMVMSALGGCWWPSEVVPRWLWTASHVFPTAWAMDAFHALISFGRGIEAVLLPAGVLVLFGIAFAAAGARFLRVEG